MADLLRRAFFGDHEVRRFQSVDDAAVLVEDEQFGDDERRFDRDDVVVVARAVVNFGGSVLFRVPLEFFETGTEVLELRLFSRRRLPWMASSLMDGSGVA